MPHPRKGFSQALRRWLQVFASPVREEDAGGKTGVAIHTYRGYGSHSEIYLMGRVFRQSSVGRSMTQSFWRDILDVLRRITRRGMPSVNVAVRFGDSHTVVDTDKDGYFRAHMMINEPLPPNKVWHKAELKVLFRSETVKARAAIYIPPLNTDYVVVSDIDDTVMYTGVANKAKMMIRLFFEKADRRAVFPGVAAFYQSLFDGGEDRKRPLLYVSRAPWTIYEMLVEFFRMHRIPEGPVLFLREWGMSWKSPLPRKAVHHKQMVIRQMMQLYKDQSFILIGDSGQKDPEVYTQMVREFPSRIKTIYIRSVDENPERDQSISELAREVHETGSTLVLAKDTVNMARHALSQGYISKEGFAAVQEEARRDETIRS